MVKPTSGGWWTDMEAGTHVLRVQTLQRTSGERPWTRRPGSFRSICRSPGQLNAEGLCTLDPLHGNTVVHQWMMLEQSLSREGAQSEALLATGIPHSWGRSEPVASKRRLLNCCWVFFLIITRGHQYRLCRNTLCKQRPPLPAPSDLLFIPHTCQSVQLLSHVQLFSTPWTAARQASLSITNSWSLLTITIGSVMPSSYLIFYRPLLLQLSIFPSIRVFSEESALPIRWPKY